MSNLIVVVAVAGIIAVRLRPGKNGHSMNCKTDGVKVTGFHCGLVTADQRNEGCP